MMPFSEKLSFLMNVTHTSNKELATWLGVDASLISLMRTGKRKLSKNSAMASNMAYFFAKRCSAAFQRQALSEMLGMTSITLGMPTEVLASTLEKWLKGENTIADIVLSEVQTLSQTESEPFVASTAPLDSSDGKTMFFFGVEGRREVMSRMVQEISAMPQPGSVLTVVDDNLEWLLSDYALTQKIQSGLMEIMAKGFTFHQIMPPLNYINRYTESLQFWLPVYATGQTHVYYYPRLRGNLYRHSIIVVPGRCVQYASSVGLGSTSDVTMFSTDLRLVNVFEKQFEELLHMCRPALQVYRGLANCAHCFPKFFSRSGETIQQSNSLSLSSMPAELLQWCCQQADSDNWKQTFQLMLEKLPQMEDRLATDPYIDMCRLATAQEVRAGTVPVVAPVEHCKSQLCYTPDTYCMHLKHILHLMDEYENYFFLPLRERNKVNYDLFVNGEGRALIVCTQTPITVLEISRPEMVTALREHLLRKAEAVGYDGIQREKVRMELHALIQELEN